MKKTFIRVILIAVLIFSCESFARTHVGLEYGGGGFDIGYLTPDFDPLNNQISLMGIGKLNKEFYTYGGRGFGYVGDNFRIGGAGAGGISKTSGVIPENNVGGNNIPELVKQVEFSMGYGGLILEYVLRTRVGVQFTAGGLIGFGGCSVEISQYENALSWDGIWQNYHLGYNGDSYNLTIRADNYFLVMDPALGAEYSILEWLTLSGKFGYFYAKAGAKSWKVQESELFAAPKLDLSSFHYQLSIIFGM